MTWRIPIPRAPPLPVEQAPLGITAEGSWAQLNCAGLEAP